MSLNKSLDTDAQVHLAAARPLFMCTGQLQRYAAMKPIARCVVACVLLVSAHSSVFALDEALDRVTTALGQLSSWRRTPEVVLRHCRIHVPTMSDELQTAHDDWQQRNAALVNEIDEVVELSVPLFARLLAMSPEQAKAWQIDSITLGIEELAFRGRGRSEVYSTCTGFPKFLQDMELDTQMKAIRSRLEIAKAGLRRGTQ